MPPMPNGDGREHMIRIFLFVVLLFFLQLRHPPHLVGDFYRSTRALDRNGTVRNGMCLSWFVWRSLANVSWMADWQVHTTDDECRHISIMLAQLWSEGCVVGNTMTESHRVRLFGQNCGSLRPEWEFSSLEIPRMCAIWSKHAVATTIERQVFLFCVAKVSFSRLGTLRRFNKVWFSSEKNRARQSCLSQNIC